MKCKECGNKIKIEPILITQRPSEMSEEMFYYINELEPSMFIKVKWFLQKLWRKIKEAVVRDEI